jgi:ornithine--oxo-acid transaminase
MNMNSQQFVELEEKHGAHNYHPLDVVIERGEGVWVYDVDGKKYLDCLSAYSAVNQGHVNPRILNAMLEQAKTVTLSSRAFRSAQLPLFYQDLCEYSGYEMCILMNSGAEGVETAVKLARKWAYVVKGVPRHQAEIVVAEGNFHGRTTTVISFSTEPSYREISAPSPLVLWPSPMAMPKPLSRLLPRIRLPFLLEPIQGEAGVVIPPAGYLKKVAELCKKHNILFIVDEIQTGCAVPGADSPITTKKASARICS